MATQDPQSRRWSLTINNPKDYGFDHGAIIEKLHLRNPGYEETATYGHFNGLRTWENSMTLHEDYRLEEVVKKYAD